MSSKLRRTGKPVNTAAVEGMWQTLARLYKESPLTFVEFVRKARKRKYQVFTDSVTRRNLLTLDLIDRQTGTVHDAYRELVAACVDGDGLQMVLYRPFKGDENAMAELVTLRNGRKANPHIVDGILSLLRNLLGTHYVPFVELVRHVRDEKPVGKLFGNSLRMLIDHGVAQVVDATEEAAAQIVQQLAEELGPFAMLIAPVILMPRVHKVVLRDTVAEIVKIAATGTTGLNFGLQSPYQTERPESASGSNGHATNGKTHAHGSGEPTSAH